MRGKKFKSGLSPKPSLDAPRGIFAPGVVTELPQIVTISVQDIRAKYTQMDANNPHGLVYLVKSDRKGNPLRYWYIQYYIWNIDLEKMVRVRKRFDLSSYNNLYQREQRAKGLISDIRDHLIHQGAYITQESDSKPRESHTIHSAFLLLEKYDYGRGRKGSISQYRSKARNFMKFARESGLANLPIEDVSTELIYRYLDQLPRSISPTTKLNYRSTLGAIFTWMMDRGMIKTNPVHDVKLRERRAAVKRNFPIPVDALEAIFRYLEENDPNLHLFTVTAYYTMFRRKETAAMQRKWIDFDSGFIFKPAAVDKAKKLRQVPLNNYLREILISRRVQYLDPDAHLFDQRGRDYYSVKFKEVLKKWGLDKRCGLHSLRGTRAMVLDRAGLSPNQIMHLGGWDDIGSYMKYIKSVGWESNEDKVNDIR